MPEPRGFELEAEEEPEFQVSAPSFEEPSESFEIDPSAVEFGLADEGGAPVGEELFLVAEGPSLGETEEGPELR